MTNQNDGYIVTEFSHGAERMFTYGGAVVVFPDFPAVTAYFEIVKAREVGDSVEAFTADRRVVYAIPVKRSVEFKGGIPPALPISGSTF